MENRKPRMSFGAGFLSVILCLLLFVTSVCAMALFAVRSTVTREALEEAVEDIDITELGFPDEDGALKELKTSLLEGASWHKPDHYYVLKDFESYRDARLKALRLYRDDPAAFSMMALKNVLASGIFSSDRTIAQYCEEIWKI